MNVSKNIQKTEHYGKYFYYGNVGTWFMDPQIFISQDNIVAPKVTGSTAKYEKRGEIKTTYNDTANPYELVDPASETYEFSNLSWINFVYRESVLTNEGRFGNSNGQDGVLMGSGTDISINGVTR